MDDLSVPTHWVDNPLIFIGEEEKDGEKGLMISVAEGMTDEEAIEIMEHCIETLKSGR
ncbi:hypothetical protein GL282_09720 [Veillonella dispar]|nr:hypothetical protein [Veillonella dispar]